MIGGQLNLAKMVPGKEEFWGLVDWFSEMLKSSGAEVKLGELVTSSDVIDFDEVIIATGVRPRDPKIKGHEKNNVVSYVEVLNGTGKIGQKVAVIGAGGIGFDVSEYLVHENKSDNKQIEIPKWMSEWGVGDPNKTPGGLAESGPKPEAAASGLGPLSANPPGVLFGSPTPHSLIHFGISICLLSLLFSWTRYSDTSNPIPPAPITATF